MVAQPVGGYPTPGISAKSGKEFETLKTKDGICKKGTKKRKEFAEC
jgi:hypothetical protein